MDEKLFFFCFFSSLWNQEPIVCKKLAQALRGKSKFLNGKRVRCDDKEGMEQKVKRLINWERFDF